MNNEILITVAHELYHAYQVDVVNGAIGHNEPLVTVNAWRQSFRNYFAPTSNSDDELRRYYNQAVEIGAFWFSEPSLIETYYDGRWFGYYHGS